MKNSISQFLRHKKNIFKLFNSIDFDFTYNPSKIKTLIINTDEIIQFELIKRKNLN